MWFRFIAVYSLAMITPASVYGCDYYFAFPHRSACYDFYFNYPPQMYRDLSRLEGELRRQRLSENQQRREHDRDIEALRQQAFANQQVSAMQACYYRTTGGFELCADLFAQEPREQERCEALVARRNPGCNEVPLQDQPDIK